MNTVMNAIIHEERIFRLVPIDKDQAQGTAGSIITSIFGIEGKLYRVKAEDITITKNKLHYEPFWHVSCHVRYEYDRICSHDITTIAPEVHRLTINEHDYTVVESNPRKFTISGIEHCITLGAKEVYVDAEREQEQDWKKYLGYQKEKVNDDSMFLDEDSIFLPPKLSSNALVQKVLLSLPRPIKANKVYEGTVNIDILDLYFRPIYTFEYEWKKRNKTIVAAFDGLTRKEIAKGVNFHEKVKKIITSDLLFDVSAEAANLIIPGSSIAFKFIKAFNSE